MNKEIIEIRQLMLNIILITVAKFINIKKKKREKENSPKNNVNI